MFGKYYDCRVSRHFVQLYSKVPYLDTEIFNVQADLLKQQRLANDRTSLTR